MKRGNWWTLFLIILLILVIVSVIRNSTVRHSMEDDITGNVINEKNYGEPQNQQGQVTEQQETYPSHQEQITQTTDTTDYTRKQNQNQEEKKCEEGYTNEHRCDGNNIQQKYQYKDCNVNWVKVELCDYGCSEGKCNSEPQMTAVTVSYVPDGDTFKLSTGETIRLIGLNAPESGQPCSSNATARLKEFVLEKKVTLESTNITLF